LDPNPNSYQFVVFLNSETKESDATVIH